MHSFEHRSGGAHLAEEVSSAAECSPGDERASPNACRSGAQVASPPRRGTADLVELQATLQAAIAAFPQPTRKKHCLDAKALAQRYSSTGSVSLDGRPLAELAKEWAFLCGKGRFCLRHVLTGSSTALGRGTVQAVLESAVQPQGKALPEARMHRWDALACVLWNLRPSRLSSHF